MLAFLLILTCSHCRGSAEESEADKGNADLLLPFLQTAGTLVLNLLGAQHHHTDAPQFNAPKSAQGQGERTVPLFATFDSALVIVVLYCGIYDGCPHVQVSSLEA